MCVVDVEVDMSNVYDLRTRFISKTDTLALRLQRSLSALTDEGSVLQNGKCDGCGESFDVLRKSHCPHCEKEYPIWEHEWVIKEFKVK